MSATSSPRPPRIACWLLDLFTTYEEAESIPGDLYEEFCGFVGKHGLKSARGWYWWQTGRSIAHLIAAAMRTSPWSIGGAVIAAIFLLRVGAPSPERAEFAILNWGHACVPFPLVRLCFLDEQR